MLAALTFSLLVFLFVLLFMPAQMATFSRVITAFIVSIVSAPVITRSAFVLFVISIPTIRPTVFGGIAIFGTRIRIAGLRFRQPLPTSGRLLLTVCCRIFPTIRESTGTGLSAAGSGCFLPGRIGTGRVTLRFRLRVFISSGLVLIFFQDHLWLIIATFTGYLRVGLITAQQEAQYPQARYGQ